MKPHVPTRHVALLNWIRDPALGPWLISGIGLLALFVPTFWGLFHGLWSGDQQGHGPIVLGISFWLLYKKWPDVQLLKHRPRPDLGWPVLAFGLLLYVLGRSQDILLFEVGSLIWLLAAITLLNKGCEALRVWWFALFFMLFMLPLPGAVVDALTQPMKLAVSYAAEAVLYSAGYPISRVGVILQVGQYQLLVADACAGLHTLFTLEALGLLYLNLVKSASIVRNLSLAILIVPISFTANVIRVMVLSLITYYLGDEAGRGFLHGFAGMVLFSERADVDHHNRYDGEMGGWPLAVAKGKCRMSALLDNPSSSSDFQLMMRRALIVACLMLVSALAAAVLKPTHLLVELNGKPDFEMLLPKQFGNWRADQSVGSQIINPQQEELLSRIYTQRLSRTYVNDRGQRIMLALAYGEDQRDGMQLHYPEVCYPAQGFSLLNQRDAILELQPGWQIPIRQLATQLGTSRSESVSYWTLLGGHVFRGGIAKKRAEIKYGLSGYIADGLLFRVSSIEKNPQDGYELHASFSRDLMAAIEPKGRERLIGVQ